MIDNYVQLAADYLRTEIKALPTDSNDFVHADIEYPDGIHVRVIVGRNVISGEDDE